MHDMNTALIEPPVETPELKLGHWIPIACDEPVVGYLTTEVWEGARQPEGWEVARRSQAVYVFREVRSGWRAVAKYYVAKTGESAEKYARRELSYIEEARQADLGTGPVRAVRAYDVWRGVLFLEFVDGLTLDDVIAVRRSRPGTVLPSLEKVARLLALLHGSQIVPREREPAAEITAEARKIVDNLARYGVLQDNPVIQEGLLRQIGRWPEKPAFHHFPLALNHGDATTTNFILSNQGEELVAIDWERSKIADPAADLGRMMAEVEHSVSQHGGNLGEAGPLLDHLVQVYMQCLSRTVDRESLLERVRYHRAVTSLRIARNGWLSRRERTRLVAQAMALLV